MREKLVRDAAESHRQPLLGAGVRGGAQRSTGESAEASGRGTVLSLTRLDCCVELVRRWRAPIFWKTGLPPGLSHLKGWEAVRECGAGATRFATGAGSSVAAARSTIPRTAPEPGTRGLSAADLRVW
jgi:hypothetical protein